jgi:hypothetical protein
MSGAVFRCAWSVALHIVSNAARFVPSNCRLNRRRMFTLTWPTTSLDFLGSESKFVMPMRAHVEGSCWTRVKVLLADAERLTQEVKQESSDSPRPGCETSILRAA